MGATKHLIKLIWCNVQQILDYSLLSAFAHSSSSTDRGKATLFNEYFHSVFNDHPGHPDISSLPLPLSVIEVFDISVGDVFNGLSSLNVHKASGTDDIPAALLKPCAVALCETGSPSFRPVFKSVLST